MKIVHVVEPFASGLATFLKLLTDELDNHTHIIVHGEREELISSDEVKKFFLKGNVKFIRWKSAKRELNPFNDFKANIELYKILNRFRNADVIHLHSSKAGFIGRVVAKQLNLKQIIYTPNGAPFLMSGVSRKKLLMYEVLEKIASKFVGDIVCSSESECVEYVNRGFKADFINNGTLIGKKSFVPNKDYSKFRIVTLGRLSEQKNPFLFNQIALALTELKHFEFVWIGDGEDIKEITAPNIKVTGWLTKKGVQDEISKADLYLSTSHFEGLPFSVMEAMSLGKCLLLSDCTGNINLVKCGVNGQLFQNVDEAVDHILYFYMNKEVTYSMGQNSIEICKDYFNIENTAYRYEQKYIQVSEKRSKKIKTSRWYHMFKFGYS